MGLCSDCYFPRGRTDIVYRKSQIKYQPDFVTDRLATSTRGSLGAVTLGMLYSVSLYRLDASLLVRLDAASL